MTVVPGLKKHAYPPEIKHGLLENSPFRSILKWCLLATSIDRWFSIVKFDCQSQRVSPIIPWYNPWYPYYIPLWHHVCWLNPTVDTYLYPYQILSSLNHITNHDQLALIHTVFTSFNHWNDDHRGCRRWICCLWEDSIIAAPWWPLMSRFIRNTYGIMMEYLWNMIVYLWFIHGLSMEYLWNMMVNDGQWSIPWAMDNIWYIDGIMMG